MGITRRSTTNCPIERAVHVVGGRWKSMILYGLLDGPARYSVLRQRMAGCAERVLVRQLRELEADGVIERRLLDASGNHVEYRLTALGEALHDMFDGMRRWGETLLARDAQRAKRISA
ncbi:winged helix-turn-helix transcriptional regulator [Gemmatimonas groenlandica]|uniref:Helix-turn-helix transcriptional regulator n=1 Tax=Gemmatimonas groenlandica TaxID=2732249 RepID=A0A6M4ISI6_9BACT|nr:helix-turn-helix domain-containing protein [Gemmatimonas groenlandica]QJR37610.1 helix-turn-helix transcriptional regulator [Gemmatimonas groenlandica]